MTSKVKEQLTIKKKNYIMKTAKLTITAFSFLLLNFDAMAQSFSTSTTNFNIPSSMDNQDWKTNESNGRHTLIDINGDGKPDLIDSEDGATSITDDVFKNGSQKYWKIYINNGNEFNATYMQWNIPSITDNQDWKPYESSGRHTLLDMNGDGKPDLIDSEDETTSVTDDVFKNGSQKYWKVYLNNGNGFDVTYIQWNIPTVFDNQDWKLYESSGKHQVIDMNGDGKPDFVDSEDEATSVSNDAFKNGSQKYWKVYLNTGSGFSSSEIQWNIPSGIDNQDWQLNEASGKHSVVDMNGDGKPDLIDSEDGATSIIDDVFMNGSQKYWKVYMNNGNGFNSSEIQWNITSALDKQDWQLNEAFGRHSLIDINGDWKPDLIDSEDGSTSIIDDVFKNGSQKYWKVYLNNGTGFNSNSLQWNIPPVSDNQDWKLFEASGKHSVVDMNGDKMPDFVDSEDEATSVTDDAFINGSQKYWKVYLNTSISNGITDFETIKSQFNIYPNPSNGAFNLNIKTFTLGKNYSYEIFNLQGLSIKQKNITKETFEIKMLNQPSGIYILKYQEGEMIITRKLIIQK